MAGDSVKTLSDLWHREVDWAVDTIAPILCHPANGAWRTHLFVEEAWAMKQFVRHLGLHFESGERLRTNAAEQLLGPVYAMVMAVAKTKVYFSSSMASAQS